jgi:hypothetical protein
MKTGGDFSFGVESDRYEKKPAIGQTATGTDAL